MIKECIAAFITILIGFIADIYLYKYITKENPKWNIKNICFLLFLTAIMTVLILINQLLLKTTSNIICIALLLSLFYKDDILKTFFYSVCLWFEFLLLDIAFSIILISNDLVYKTIINNYYLRSFSGIPLILFQFLFVATTKNVLNNLYKKYYLKVTKNITFTFLITFIIVLLAFLSSLNAFQSDIKLASYFIILIIFIFLLLVIYLIKYIIKSYNLVNINKNVIDENKLVRELSQRDQIFKHNLINNLLGIETVANKKTKLLIDELIMSYKNDYEKINNINELPSGIQGLIYKKISLKNIPDLNFIVENSFKEDIVELMTPKNYNALVESIGILIDNALEAVEKCENKIIVIDTRKVGDNIYFEIKNSFNSIIDFDFLGKKNYTTKKEGHGIGINHLIKNKNIDIKASILDNLFCVEIVVKLKK